MTIEERLEKLEMELTHAKSRNRLLLTVVLLVALVMAIPIGKIAMTEGVGWGEKVVKANLFILVDENEKTRAGLSMNEDGPDLAMYDKNDKLRVRMSVHKDGTFLAMFDENEKDRVELRVLKDGPALALFDENDKNRVGLGVVKDGPRLALFDENGKGRAILGTNQVTTPDGKVISYPESSLLLFDQNGNVIWMAPP